MSEQIILEYLRQKVKSLGYDSYKLQLKDLMVVAESTLEVLSYSQIHFIIRADTGMSVSSDTGEYDRGNMLLRENSLEHSGSIRITNHTGENKNIQFIQIILINQ